MTFYGVRGWWKTPSALLVGVLLGHCLVDSPQPEAADTVLPTCPDAVVYEAPKHLTGPVDLEWASPGGASFKVHLEGETFHIVAKPRKGRRVLCSPVQE